MKLNKIKSKKQERMKTVAISSIVTIILLVLVSTVIVGFILAWSKNEVKTSLDVSKENLKQLSEFECKNVKYTVESCKLDKVNNNIEIVFTNSSQVNLFNIVLSITGRNELGEQMNYIGSFNDVIKKGESRTLSTSADNFNVIRQGDTFPNLNVTTLDSIMLTNGACPNKPINLSNCDLSLLVVSTPTFSVSAGTYSTIQNITLSTEAGATIHYTIDGTTPTSSSAVYLVPLVIPLDTNRTIKAMATRPGYTESSVSSADYVITHQLQTPSPSVSPGMYSPEQTLTLSGEAGSTYYYTLDGSTPTTGSTLYSGSITITYGYTTFKVLAIKSTYGDSNIYTGNYYVYRPGRYWIGGTGSWSDTSHWSTSPGGTSGATVPSASNDVFFDGNSFSVNGGVVTLDVNANCLSMDWSAITKTVTFSNSLYTLNVYGDFILDSNLTWSTDATAAILKINTTTSMIFDTKGIQMAFGANGGGLIFNGSGTYNLANTIIATGNPGLTVNSGTLNTNGYNLDFAQVRFNGTSIINLGASTLTTIIYYSATTVTLNAGTSTLKTKTTATLYAVNGGNKVYYNIDYSGQTTGYIDGITSCNNFIFTTVGTALNLNLGSNIIINGTFTINGLNATANRALITSNTIGTVRKITAANVVASNVDFRDVNFVNPINLADINGKSGDAGGNYGITFTTAVPQYFKHTSGAVSWSDATKWFSDYNRTVAGRVPLPQDDAIFDQNSFTGTSTLTVDAPRIGRSLDMSAVDDAVTMAVSNSIEVYGSFILYPNISINTNGYKDISFLGRSNYSVSTFNTSSGNMLRYFFNSIGGSYTLQSDFYFFEVFSLQSGTLDLNDFNTFGGMYGYFGANPGSIFYMGNGTMTIIRNYAANATGFFNSAITYCEGSTIKFNLTGENNHTSFSGGGKVYNKLWISGTQAGNHYILGSNTFSEIRIDPGRKVQFTAGTTQTITGDLNATGTDINRITLASTVAGSYWKISKSSGIISSDYLDLSDSNATGGATWYAGANSLDTNHNTGWIFTAIPGRYWVGGTGNWSDINHWAVSPGGAGGASVPTSSDDVFFTAASFNVDGNVVTLDVNASAKSVNFSGLDQNMTLTSTINSLSVYGSLTLSTKLAVSFTNTASLNFKATTSVNINANGNTSRWLQIIFDGVGGTWTLLSDWNIVGTNSIYSTNGTLNTNNYNLATTSIVTTSTNAFNYVLGSSVLTLNQWYAYYGGTTLDAGTSTFKVASLWLPGDKNYYNVELDNVTQSSSAGSVSRAIYNNLTIKRQFIVGGNQTINGTLTIKNTIDTQRVLIASRDIGIKYVFTTPSALIESTDFKDINGSGAFNWDLSSITGGSGNAGGNSGILFSTATPQYFKHTSGAVSWSDSTKWFSDYNRTVAGRVPLPQDDVTFDANSFSGTSTLTVNVPRIGRSLDMSAVDDAVTMSLANDIQTYGNFILGNNISTTATYSTVLMGRGNYYLNTFGKTIQQLMIAAYDGTYSNLSNLNVNVIFDVQYGTFDFNDFNFTTNYLFQQRGGIIYCGDGLISINTTASYQYMFARTNGAFYSEGSTFKFNPVGANNLAINLNGVTFNTVWFSGTHTGSFDITGSNTINNLQIDPGRKVRFTAGTTTTITGDLNATGTDVNNRITLGSITAGSYWKISKASGISSNDYLDISDSNATGGATWYAGGNSIDTNHNSGWIFSWPIDNLAFNSRKKITISKTNVDSNLTNFPLLVKISGDANIGSVAMEDGNDLRFTDSSGNLLYSEKEDFNISDGLATGNFWVKVPSISSVTDTNIYVYYGSAGASAQTGSTNVWDSNYLIVQHMNKIDNNTIADSTIYNNIGTAYSDTSICGGISGCPHTVSGKIGNAITFDGINDYILLPDIMLPINGTISFGINLNLITSTKYFIGGATSQGIRYSGTKFLVFNGSGGWIEVDWTKEDRLINFTAVRINSTDYDIYVDNNKIGTGYSGTSGADIIVRYISRRPDGLYFMGPIDEVRISSTARPASWIKFEYSNMNSVNNELTFGAEE